MRSQKKLEAALWAAIHNVLNLQPSKKNLSTLVGVWQLKGVCTPALSQHDVANRMAGRATANYRVQFPAHA